ncbi:hypothetical protein [Mycolicibacterium diernhoferi]|uniref:Uncharacterized protein n=1 Tax=Mycolicibacterium diernhoferi TaxID=1801 RepID=A0A1Q4HM92_9MYCO|nr:hypothetical protein [Mycolicibacterium diernhoferi]OJZ68654.1 hypothetical protein BRW64_03585 [Mycolicibacterium diernhoferi]OPE53940.1 hypothetical protein BV510_12890 [Mycolicibacterium diernhoferi]PEG52002.1 hypothetical protein CRI78_23490 [Mycolicibacterium diernhoferi]QYL20843.1 hypothetical protein K0O62_17435 [Mycolicibacterium diernhoferi]
MDIENSDGDTNDHDEQARFAMTPGDRLRACDFAVAFGEYIQDGDYSRVWTIVVDTQLAGDTVADGLARMQNLLLAYTHLSIPFDKASIEHIRQLIVEDEFRGMDFGQH